MLCFHASISDNDLVLLDSCVLLDPVVQSIVSLTSSLRGQLVKYFTTLLPNTHKFFVENMREAFAMQKFSYFFDKNFWYFSDISVLNFNETLTTSLV